jgi:hypothetical protein
MRSLILLLGLAVLAAAAFMVMPREILGFGLGWGNDVRVFLRGALPVVVGLIGLSMVLIGIVEIVRKPE